VSKIKHSAKSFFAECFFIEDLPSAEKKRSIKYLVLDKEPNSGKKRSIKYLVLDKEPNSGSGVGFVSCSLERGSKRREKNASQYKCVTRTRSLTCICGKKKVAVKTDLREFFLFDREPEWYSRLPCSDSTRDMANLYIYLQ
jgi:hypothetical protein